MRISDWSSDVCSSDLARPRATGRRVPHPGPTPGTRTPARPGRRWLLLRAAGGAAGSLGEEEDDEADEGEGLDEGDAEEHGGAHHAGGLGLAGHGLDGLADEVADADAGADGAENVGQGGAALVVDARSCGFLGQYGEAH